MGRKLEKFCPLRVFHTGAKSKFTQINLETIRVIERTIAPPEGLRAPELPGVNPGDQPRGSTPGINPWSQGIFPRQFKQEKIL